MRHWSSCLPVLSLLLILVAPALAAGPQVGQMAPSLRLQDQNSHWHSPSDFRGHWLGLYFYAKDFTVGCTTEACSFRDDIAQLRKAGADVAKISLDDVKSHADFAAKYLVPFPLLADGDHAVATAYGVLATYKDQRYAKRTTFLIDPQGTIAKVYVDVDPETNSAQVMHDLAALKAAA